MSYNTLSMMVSIAQVVLITSFFSMAAILIWKIPVLKELKVNKKTRVRSFLTPRERIKKTLFLKNQRFFKLDFWNIFLQRILSKIKVLSLRIEAKSSRLLEKMREKTKKGKESEKYWEKVTKFSLRKKKKPASFVDAPKRRKK